MGWKMLTALITATSDEHVKGTLKGCDWWHWMAKSEGWTDTREAGTSSQICQRELKYWNNWRLSFGILCRKYKMFSHCLKETLNVPNYLAQIRGAPMGLKIIPHSGSQNIKNSIKPHRIMEKVCAHTLFFLYKNLVYKNIRLRFAQNLRTL